MKSITSIIALSISLLFLSVNLDMAEAKPVNLKNNSACGYMVGLKYNESKKNLCMLFEEYTTNEYYTNKLGSKKILEIPMRKEIVRSGMFEVILNEMLRDGKAGGVCWGTDSRGVMNNLVRGD